jgi:PhzF family phenazine biosynthesis protein
MRIPYYHVDAFARERFHGNPAGVCLLETWLPDETLLGIAAENRHSETAFVMPHGAGYELRWFTPHVEVSLCGHGTLAAGHVLLGELGRPGPTLRFTSKSGLLTVTREGDLLWLDFPARQTAPCPAPEALLRGLGAQPLEVHRARSYLALFATPADVLALQPDMDALSELDASAVIVTAPGEDVDFVSRFFAPKIGIPEDPVTGSAHCTLAPFWSARLGKRQLHARQLAARGGELWCEDGGERVRIGGQAVTYLRGEIEI